MQNPYGIAASEKLSKDNSILTDVTTKNQDFQPESGRSQPQSILPYLQKCITRKQLSESLVAIERLGYQGDAALLVLALAQYLGGEA